MQGRIVCKLRKVYSPRFTVDSKYPEGDETPLLPGLNFNAALVNFAFVNTYRIKTFGITREILGGKEAVIELPGTSVQELRAVLYQKYPRLKGLRSLMIAVNNEYAGEEDLLAEADEIALIPPVSGG